MQNKWQTNRHDHYPTVDNEFTSKWNYYKIMTSVVENKIYKEITKMYPVKKEDIGINELFLVKYDYHQQRELEEHTDGSEFSFIIALNDQYTGGGTYFPDLKEHIKLEVGDCLVFSGQNKHKGVKITSGKRYIFTGFLHYKNRYFCNEY